MAHTDYTCRSGGSNLNAGTRTGSGEEGTSPAFTYASGSWNASTTVFTVGSGNPLTDGVAVGDLVSLCDQSNSLRCTGASNSSASTPDSAALSLAGDIDIRVKLRLDDWTPGAVQNLVTKWNTTGNNRSYALDIQTNGVLRLQASDTGSASDVNASSTVATSFADGAVGWIRVTLDADNGAGGKTTTFYTSTDGTTWNALGSAVTTAGTITVHDGTTAVFVGSLGGNTLLAVGNIFSVEIRDGIAGTVVASPDFAAQSIGTTSFADAQGNTWTLGANASIAAMHVCQGIGRVSARDATTITVGTRSPSTPLPSLTGICTLRVGGAWKGPNGIDYFPFSLTSFATVNLAGDPIRVNLKNDQTYNVTPNGSITSIAIVATHSTPLRYQGYTNTFGDAGKFVLDGGLSGGFTLLTLSGATLELWDFDLQNNGNSASQAGLSITGTLCDLYRGKVHGMRGSGINSTVRVAMTEVEVYGNNLSNAASQGGILHSGGASALFRRCAAHDNVGSNTAGILFTSNPPVCLIDRCVIDSNGTQGVQFNGTGVYVARRSDFYGNAGVLSGLHTTTSGARFAFYADCNFCNNGGYGIRHVSGQAVGQVTNCGFGTGGAANSSGTTNGTTHIQETGSVLYAAGVTPWQDPANGDFSVALLAAKGQGTAFSSASGTATRSRPDRGAAQSKGYIGVPRSAAVNGGAA